MSLLTCKDFLLALNEYLDETKDADLRREVESHVNQCPNCWVVFDTTQKTLKVFRGVEASPLPEAIHKRLMERVHQRVARKE